MENRKEKIEEMYNYCLFDKFELEDVENRKLYINSVIDSEVIDQIVYHIMRYNMLDKDIAIENRQPIRLYINSNGGSVTDGYALIDAIMTSKTPVHTINQGVCYSMGFLIFICGHKRFSMPSSTLLMHDGSTAAWDSMAKVKDRIEFETKQMEEYTKQYILAHTEIGEELYDAKYRMEWYMYPQEAQQYGITDYIVGYDCSIDEIV